MQTEIKIFSMADISFNHLAHQSWNILCNLSQIGQVSYNIISVKKKISVKFLFNYHLQMVQVLSKVFFSISHIQFFFYYLYKKTTGIRFFNH